MRKKKLLLINPVSDYRKGFVRTEFTRYPPIAYGIIAALTPDNWEIEIIDESFSDFTYKDADFVGLTAYTSSIYKAYQIAEIYKSKNIPVVMGGVHVSMVPNEAIQYCNSVVIGEVESCWSDVLSDFETGELKEFYHGERLGLENIPPIDYSIFNPDYIMGSVQTTRGCPFNCEFCSVTSFNGGKYRMRPVENVLNEIEKIPQDKFFFIDDNIIGYSKASKEHARNIFQGMIDRGINKKWWSQASLNFADDEELIELAFKSGCRLIFIGIEAETNAGLKSTNKRLNKKFGPENYNKAFAKIRKAGIAVLGSFIFGLDSDLEEDLYNRRDYIKSFDIDCYQTGILTPSPGTQTYKRMDQANRILRTDYPKDWQYYSVMDVTFVPENMTPERLAETMSIIWNDIYSKNVIYKKFLKTLRETRNADAAAWALATNISYHNMKLELEGKDKMDIETFIGPYQKMFTGKF